MKRYRTRVLTVPGGKIRVRQLAAAPHARAAGPGRPFVLVHGIGVSSRYFEPLAAELDDHGDVYLLDLPGFGGVPRPRHRMDITQFAQAVHAAIVAEGIEDPVLVGHSMGAQVVTELLVNHPDDAHAAVLVGPPVNPAEQSVATQMRRLAESSVAESRATRLVAVRAYLRCGLSWIVEVLPGMMSYPMVDKLPHVTARTVVLRGEHDRVAPQDWVDEVVRLLPDAQGATVAGAAHAVVYDHAHDVAVAALRLAGIDPGPGEGDADAQVRRVVGPVAGPGEPA